LTILASNESQSGIFPGKKLSEHTAGRLFHFRDVYVNESDFNIKYHRLIIDTRGI